MKAGKEHGQHKQKRHFDACEVSDEGLGFRCVFPIALIGKADIELRDPKVGEEGKKAEVAQVSDITSNKVAKAEEPQKADKPEVLGGVLGHAEPPFRCDINITLCYIYITPKEEMQLLLAVICIFPPEKGSSSSSYRRIICQKSTAKGLVCGVAKTDCACRILRKRSEIGGNSPEVYEMYRLTSHDTDRIYPTTFAELGMQERDIEEILRRNIDILCDEEESILIVGQQVRSTANSRSDLVAVDNSGNIVLIEIKRDLDDIGMRSESLELQAIRYAASYGTINRPEDLVELVYAPYIDKHRNEFELGDLTPYELGVRKLTEFLEVNDALHLFNHRQRIMLVASDFDKETLSAVAWLISNNVNISCHKLTPYVLNDAVYLYPEKLLPVPQYDEFYVDLIRKPSTALPRQSSRGSRRSLPRINDMLRWEVVKPGDILVPRGKPGEAILQANGFVLVEGQEKSLQEWLRGIFGWSSVNTYDYAVHKDSGKTLAQIRQEYLDNKQLHRRFV